MSLEHFQICLDNPLLTYFSGQHVTGHVAVKLAQEKRLRVIEIKFLGEAEVRWSESESYTRNGKTEHRTVVYHSREIYIENVVCVLGQPDTDITLPPGEYLYYFALILPPTAPSSFEGEIGRVRYTIKSKIVRPWRFNHECKVAFTVLNMLDLNNCLNVQNPLMTSVEKFLCCGCCRSGPITIVVSLPFTGFVPGQRCQAMAEVDNLSNSEVTVSGYLVQNITYTAARGSYIKHREARGVVTEEKLGIVESRGSKTFSTNIVIPALPASLLLYCNIIDISYFFGVKGAISGFHKDAIIELPVVIGTIPLRNQFQSLIPANTVIASPFSGDNNGNVMTESGERAALIIPAVPPGVDYPDMHPPSYEECVSGKANIRSEDDSSHLQGNMDFAPRYPTYHFK